MAVLFWTGFPLYLHGNESVADVSVIDMSHPYADKNNSLTLSGSVCLIVHVPCLFVIQ